MFAVKQAVGSIARRVQSTIKPGSNFSQFTPSWTLLLKQTLSTPEACFSCSSNLAAAAKEPQEEPPSNFTSEIIGEPDVLYHEIVVESRCSDPAVLRSYTKFITLAAQHLGLTISKNESQRKPHIKRWTVLKSRFVHKKHMVQYEVRTYHQIIGVERLTGSTADTFLEYIQRNLPEGVSMRVQRVRMEKLPEHLLTPPSHDTEADENPSS
ncbi:hypothetical protein ONE63_007532 [Megalurothrips usitatus]|uniref:Small ribosomal subunit protein uS10m n=1 Tax=Megalurothrips usitatus TaxID=439358 RepID=A0AAV7XSV0_9NEOP|nr:hypothetical protein ONE63_007532 [Megalurothrips usitatus]